MIRVGITGGIGSGKSSVTRIFSCLGTPVYDADSKAKALMIQDPELRKAISDAFGPESYSSDGALNRSWLAQRVFRDEVALAQLNALVHPVLEQDFMIWAQEQEALEHPVCIKEAAILLESGSYQSLDLVVLVTAPEELRIKRVVERDGLSPEEVRLRIQRQWPDEKKQKMAQVVILNDGVEPIIPQVLALHQKWYQGK